jgi:cation transport ATPase
LGKVEDGIIDAPPLAVADVDIAVMADIGATVLVTLNAVRLLRYRFG